MKKWQKVFFLLPSVSIDDTYVPHISRDTGIPFKAP